MVMVLVHPIDGTLIRVAELPKAVPPGREVKIAPVDVSTTPAGRIVAAFATLGQIDSDSDVTVAGAFPTTTVPMSQWGHASWQPGFLPIGKGAIREEGNRAIFRGEMFMRTQAGRETFEALRGLGPLAEFSYGYNVAEADRGMFEGQMVRFLRKLIVSEISPVLRGAGVRTGVIEMSSLDPMQIMLASAQRDNERALARLQGYTPARKFVGYAPDGQRVYVGAGGRK